MRHRWPLLLIGAAALVGAGCATSQEWATWREHPVHFASTEHMGFSVRNRTGTPPRVRRQDIVSSATEQWWGRAITVPQEEVLER